MRRTGVLAVVLLGCTPADGGPPRTTSAEEEWSTLGSFRAAHALVQRGLEALGGAGAIERVEGLALGGEGTIDLGTLLQGRTPFEGDRHAVQERLLIVPGRLVHELRAPVNVDAMSWTRTDYRPSGTYRMNLVTRRASWTRPADPAHLRRLVPHLLLEEILSDPGGLRHLGTVRADGAVWEAVTWHAPERGLLTLLFDPSTHLLAVVESLADLPVRGDAQIRFSFHEYSTVPGLGPLPTGYSITVDGETLQDIRWTARATAPAGGMLDPPEDVELPEPTPFDEDEGAVELDIRELAPGVHLLVNLRIGFHMLFVELADGIVAVDAPSGWWELQELPPFNWAESASPELGERYLQGIRSRLGDKPIRYVVLTHHHSDHAGGVRAFVEAGATVIAAEPTRPVVERTLRGSLALAGRPDTVAPALSFEAVRGERTLSDGSREVRVIDVGPNPHAEGMLVVWLPETRILYVSDLFDPWGTSGAPAAERLPVMRWFVEWLDRSGLEPDRIYAIHGSAGVTPEHLAEIRRMSADGS